jgi:exonuclease 3'-5' domain-containing protein 1
MQNALTPCVVDRTEHVVLITDWLVKHHATPVPNSPTMYIDLEGVALCREGSLSIFTLFLDIPKPEVVLIDVYTLGAQAFNTPGTLGKTLTDILQDVNIPKVFFDVRNDSDALFAHFGVALQGVQDVQLMESATRNTTISRKFVSGLAKCIEKKVLGSGIDQAKWKQAKEKGEHLFLAKHGGSYDVFNRRPMLEEIVSYCIGDVQCLPELRSQF